MRFNFRKKKSKNEIVPFNEEFNTSLPEIYRGMQVHESESDRFCTFDEDYFAGESYEIKVKKKRISIPPPKTPPTFFAGIFLGALSILALSGGIAFLSLFSKFGGIYTSVTVPDLTALSKDEAVSLIENNYDYFDYLIEYKENPYVPDNSVISQIPKPSTARKLYGINGRITIKLTVSKSTDKLTLPNLVGQNARDVALELQNAGVNVFLTEVYSDTVGVGRIISSSHPIGSKIQKNDAIYITASLGKKISYVNTPDLIGMSESAAINCLKKEKLDLNKVIYKSSALPLGTVIEQSLKGGSSVREGSKITISVSGGSYPPDNSYINDERKIYE